MFYDIVMRGLTHLSLNNSESRQLPSVVEDLCNLRRKHQRQFTKLAQLKETVELESARLNGATNGGNQPTTTSPNST